MRSDRRPRAGARLIRVVIATTRGPLEVSGLTPIQGDESVICRQGSTEQVGISQDGHYEDFVREGTGIIRRVFGGGSYRMDVCRPQLAGAAAAAEEPPDITGGASWQAGAFLAHAAAGEDRLATAGQPAGDIVWVTGAIDISGSTLRRIDGLDAKLHSSMAALKTFRTTTDATITVCLPAANRAEFEALPDHLHTDIAAVADRVVFATGLGDLLEPVRLHQFGPRLSYLGHAMRVSARLLLFAALIAGGAWLLNLHVGSSVEDLWQAMFSHPLEPPRLGYLMASSGPHVMLLVRPQADQPGIEFFEGTHRLAPQDTPCRYGQGGDCTIEAGALPSPASLGLFSLDPPARPGQDTTAPPPGARTITAELHRCRLWRFTGGDTTHPPGASASREAPPSGSADPCADIPMQTDDGSRLDIRTRYDATGGEIGRARAGFAVACLLLLAYIYDDIYFRDIMAALWRAMRITGRRQDQLRPRRGAAGGGRFDPR